MPHSWKCVKDHRGRARLVKGLLENNGIATIIKDGLMSTIAPYIAPDVTILVSEERYEDAMEIIRERDKGKDEEYPFTLLLKPHKNDIQHMEQQFSRIAVKVGSNVLTRRDGTLDVTRMSALVDQIAELHKTGVENYTCISGAVASGRREVHPTKKLDSVDQRQLFSPP